MTSSKSTKRALISSALAILMCVAMLIGTTFAWFTDTASTGVNKIVAGNLDIEVQYRTTADGEWKTLDNATDLFGAEGTLFEPGHTRVVELKITNAGNLALKYKIGMNVVSETAGTNKAGNLYKLSDYLKVAATGFQQYPAEGGIAQAMEWAIFQPGMESMWESHDFANFYLEFASNGNVHALQPGAAQILGIKVYMPETVGNEANAISTEKAAFINFGLNVVATQYTTESDSFGTQYDKDAEYPILVTTGDELQAIVSNATAPVNIVLTNSITTNNFVIPADKDVTLDLNGRTVTNAGSHTILNKGHLTLTDSSADKSGQIISLKGNTAALRNGDNAVCVVEGGTISRDGANGNTWHVVENFGKMTFNGGKVVLKNGNGFAITNGWNYFDPGASTTHAVMEINALELDTDSSGIKNCRYGDLTVNDVTVNSTGYWALSNDYLGTAVINGGTLTSNSFKAVSNGAAMTVNGGTFDGTEGFVVQSYATSTVLNGGTFANMNVDALASYVGTGHTAQQSGTSVIIK